MAYTKHPFVSVAAVLPSFWSYREVGKAIHESTVPDNRFKKWIDTHAGGDFDKIVCRAIEVFDALAIDSNEKTQ